jgi:hypothetical protein
MTLTIEKRGEKITGTTKTFGRQASKYFKERKNYLTGSL